MSLDSFLQNLRSLGELITGVPVGSGAFYLLLGVTLFALLVAGKLITSALGGGGRGFVPIFLAQVLIVALGLLGAALVLTVLAPHTSSVLLLRGATITGAGAGAFTGVVLFSRFLMGVPRGVGLAVTILTLAIGYGALWGAQQLLGSGEQVLEEYQKQVTE